MQDYKTSKWQNQDLNSDLSSSLSPSSSQRKVASQYTYFLICCGNDDLKVIFEMRKAV